jgi:hypothetical protein
MYLTPIYTLHVPTSFYTQESIYDYILLRPNTYTRAHTFTHIKILYMFTYIYKIKKFYAHLLINVFIHTIIWIYRITYWNIHTPMLVYIFLRSYNYSSLHTSTSIYQTRLHSSTFIYQYMFTHFYINASIHVCLIIRLNVYMRLQTSTAVYALYTFTYYCDQVSIYVYVLRRT